MEIEEGIYKWKLKKTYSESRKREIFRRMESMPSVYPFSTILYDGFSDANILVFKKMI